MVVHSGTIDTAGLAVDLGDRGLQAILSAGGGARGAVGGSSGSLAVGLALRFRDLSTLRGSLVNIPTNLEIPVTGGSGSCACFAVGILILGTLKDDGIGRRLPRLESTRSVADNLEVASEGRANLGWSLFGIDLRIYC